MKYGLFLSNKSSNVKAITDISNVDVITKIINEKAKTANVHINCIYILGLSLLITLLYLFTGIHEHTVYAASGFKIYDYSTKKTTVYNGIVPIVTVNGTQIEDDRAQGILVNGIALLPYDTTFKTSQIAADCTYDMKKGSVTISKYGTKITMTIGSKKASVNGKPVTLSVAPMKVKYSASGLTKVLVPSRFVSETLGLGYTWNSSIRTIAIEKKSILLSYEKGAKFEYSDLQTKVTINGRSIDLGNMPGIIVNNIAMLRAKKVFADSAIGADYSFSKSNGQITLKKSDITLVMTIGSKIAYLNNEKVNLDNAPINVTNHETVTSFVMVPGRNTANLLGYDYVWDKASLTSRITTKNKPTDSNNASDTNSQQENNNNDNTSTDNNNTNNTNTEPELGDDGVYVEPGTVIKEWRKDATSYENSSGIYELNSGINYSGTAGQVYYVSRDYNTNKNNSETYMFISSIPFGKVTSYSSDGLVRITAMNLSCTNQIYQFNGTESNIINYIAMSNIPDSYETAIELSIIPEDYQYDLRLSTDKQTLYITIYKNTMTSAIIGVNEDGDYLTLGGTMPLIADVIVNSGQININLPYALNGLDDIYSDIIGTRYIRQVYTFSGADKVQIILITYPGYEYYIIENGNEYTLSLRPQGSAGNKTDTDTAWPDTGYDEPETPITDKSGYEIIIPRPYNLHKSMITDEDFYHKNYFVLRLKGDHTEYYKNNKITYSSKNIKDITVSLNADGDTEIKIVTTKLQGYRIALDSDAICVDIGDPRTIYKNIVVLDPGHGGGANGAQYFGSKEKDINLKILYALGRKYFDSDTSKLKVYYTRVTDVDMPLSERAAFVQKVGADLFVSLHMNAAEGAPNARGSEVFYSVKNNSPNSVGLRSQDLAELLNTKLYTTLGTINRGVKKENYTVIYKNTVPAVLIELGFMSNKDDYALLVNETFQDKTAKTIYEAMLDIFEKYPTGR